MIRKNLNLNLGPEAGGSEFRSTSKGRAYYFFRQAARAGLCRFPMSRSRRVRVYDARQPFAHFPILLSFFLFFFPFLFFARGCATLPGPRFYARRTEQVKRPLQLSHSCRLCPTYIRDEPLSSVHVHVRVCVSGLEEW